jgi:acetyltransferase
MEFFFNPKGVALIGATGNPTKTGQRILKNLMIGFKGKVHPVNPRYEEVEGLTCYASVLEVPDPVDLAIVMIPAPMVPAAIRECAERGIPGVIIESAGFAETGERGKALQDELTQIRLETGIRLWGPNCMGLVDAVHNHVFSFVVHTLRDHGFVAGNVSLIVQSGFLSAGFLVDILSHRVTGISKACSIGNKMDVDECDLLEYLIEDSHTEAIGLYLESIPNGRRFMDLCRSTTKPIVVLKGGKSTVGAEAAMSHTASLAGDGAVVTGALAQVGVVEASDFNQMMDLCRALVDQVGLELSELSPATRDTLKKVYPAWMPVANPIDLWPAIEINGPQAYATAFEALCTDPTVDAVLFNFFALGFLNEKITPLAEAVRATGKPVFCWLMGMRDSVREIQMSAHEQGIPVFRELYRAVECMAAVLKRKRAGGLETPEISLGGAMELPNGLEQVLEDEQGNLDEHLSKRVLAACEIPVVEEEIVSSADEAARVASGLGFPVVMKGLVPGEIHKTELGLVRLGIASTKAAAVEFEDLKAKMDGRGKVVVQQQVQGELELIVGLVRDPQFGPCVMLGLGGVMAEVLRDSVFAVAPLSRSDALGLISRLKAQELLDGFRGAPAVDREALSRILIQIGGLGLAYSRVREVDINPVIVSKGKPVAVDASVILAD